MNARGPEGTRRVHRATDGSSTLCLSASNWITENCLSIAPKYVQTHTNSLISTRCVHRPENPSNRVTKSHFLMRPKKKLRSTIIIAGIKIHTNATPGGGQAERKKKTRKNYKRRLVADICFYLFRNSEFFNFFTISHVDSLLRIERSPNRAGHRACPQIHIEKWSKIIAKTNLNRNFRFRDKLVILIEQKWREIVFYRFIAAFLTFNSIWPCNDLEDQGSRELRRVYTIRSRTCTGSRLTRENRGGEACNKRKSRKRGD